MNESKTVLPAKAPTARGLNKCVWCGKMAKWDDLREVHHVEMIDIHGTIAESDYREHKGPCPKR